MVSSAAYVIPGINTEYTSHFIITKVCQYLNTTLDQLRVRDRSREVTEKRQLLAYLLYFKVKGLGVREVGNIIERDHSSVTYALKTINNLLSSDKKLKTTFTELEVFLKIEHFK